MSCPVRLLTVPHSASPHFCCRLNVDMLKLIQLGLTFTDSEGNLPRINGELCVWQFNFRWVGVWVLKRGGCRAGVPIVCCYNCIFAAAAVGTPLGMHAGMRLSVWRCDAHTEKPQLLPQSPHTRR